MKLYMLSQRPLELTGGVKPVLPKYGPWPCDIKVRFKLASLALFTFYIGLQTIWIGRFPGVDWHSIVKECSLIVLILSPLGHKNWLH